MKLLAFLKSKSLRIRTIVIGIGAFILGLSSNGCSESEKEEKKVASVSAGKYRIATVTTGPGNPGRATYSLTGPGGAETSMTAIGYAEDTLVGDLDNDGTSGDVALVMREGNNVTVICLVGDTLQSPVQYPTGANPVAVAVGDVNGDDFTDLVTANSGTYLAGNFTPGSLSLLLGQSDGTFGSASTLTGTSPLDVQLGDFDGDEILDLAVVNGSDELNGPDVTTRGVLMRLGLGDGTFGSEIPVATAQRALALEVVDFNKDGNEDIVTTGSVLLGNGEGTFAAPVEFAPGIINPRLIKVEDVNYDEKLDIILYSFSRSALATIVLGHGDGTVSAPRHYMLNGSARTVAYYDEDGDDVSDLLFSGNSVATLMPGRGDGTFQWVQAVSTSPDLLDQPSSATGAAVADFTGDGIPDVVVANGGAIRDETLNGNAAVILPGLGGGKLGNPIAIPGQPGSRVVTGDWNADEKPDLAFVGSESSSGGTGGYSAVLTISLGLGGGAFGPYTSTALPGTLTSSASSPSIFTAFLDHDSSPDLLVGNVGGNEISVFLGNGIGSFAAQAPVVIATTPSDDVGDFNGDTHADLVVAYEGGFDLLDGALKLAFGNGNGTFQTPQILRDSIAAKGVAAADFNRDGHLDLALAMEVTTFNWEVAIYLGQGNGAFAAPMPLGLSQYTLVAGVLALDADQDGKQDLVVSHGGGSLALRGIGDGTFSPVLTAPLAPYAVMSADLNQDGWPDLLAPDEFLAFYINDVRELSTKHPLLVIERVLNSVSLRWPSFYPDHILNESPDLRLPFTPSSRQMTTLDGFFNVVVETDEAKAGFFRLESEEDVP